MKTGIARLSFLAPLQGFRVVSGGSYLLQAIKNGKTRHFRRGLHEAEPPHASS